MEKKETVGRRWQSDFYHKDADPILFRGEQPMSKSKTYLAIKRLCDIVVSIIALICLIPVFAVMFILYRFGENRGPMIYKQERIGKNGKPFKIWKFRSMVVNADKKLKANPALYKKYLANSYKLPAEEDPRITHFGRIIRKTSIDELPQFINILKGDMALVGPRPVVRTELKEYGDNVRKLLSMTPGAMGYWQASGRSNIGYPERCDIEMYYIDHANFWFDVKIVFLNIISIFKSTGAY
ncbi:multidrug MFS transporter [Loigolactobacillus backii]|uniref:Multidrug MFS transporter n=2 Tax=Lactobacillaceae TaxID=33958 RepID=A0A192H3L0_9LACO|nr:multidrug MFS transporter [Loigolactobacillus backii]ANK70448.1 multidrug MFS transporter [Loigolactobacillus backii]